MVRNHQDGYPYLNFSLFLLLKIYRITIFFGKIDWSINSGPRWAGDYKGYQKNISIFKTQQKMVTKFGQFKKLKYREGSQLCKLSQLCYHFLSRFENKNIYFLISLAIPRPSRSGIHWPINFTKKINVSVYFQTKKSDKFFGDPSLLFSFALFFSSNVILIFLLKKKDNSLHHSDKLKGLIKGPNLVFKIYKEITENRSRTIICICFLYLIKSIYPWKV